MHGSLDKLVSLISAAGGFPAGAVSKESRLLHDLGITGDDAEELLKQIEKEFNVTLQPFPFGDYFTGEPGLKHVLSRLGLTQPISRQKKPLTVGDLLDLIEAQRK